MAEESQDTGSDRTAAVQGVGVIESRRGKHREQDPAGVRAGKAFPHARAARRETRELAAARSRQSAPGDQVDTTSAGTSASVRAVTARSRSSSAPCLAAIRAPRRSWTGVPMAASSSGTSAPRLPIASASAHALTARPDWAQVTPRSLLTSLRSSAVRLTRRWLPVRSLPWSSRRMPHRARASVPFPGLVVHSVQRGDKRLHKGDYLGASRE
jgi:hypothetical protein